MICDTGQLGQFDLNCDQALIFEKGDEWKITLDQSITAPSLQVERQDRLVMENAQ